MSPLFSGRSLVLGRRMISVILVITANIKGNVKRNVLLFKAEQKFAGSLRVKPVDLAASVASGQLAC